MTLRKATPQEAETLWNIRNQAIRHGCTTSYDAEVIARWTPDLMPERYRQMVIEYPFYVVEDEKGDVAASGYLDLDTHCLEAIFTLPAASAHFFLLRPRLYCAACTQMIRIHESHFSVVSVFNVLRPRR